MIINISFTAISPDGPPQIPNRVPKLSRLGIQSMKTGKGFTLIELLVVIAIIGLLVAVILPALKAAKIQAQMVVCLANMNGLSKAYHAYTSENNTFLINGDVPRYPGQQGMDLAALTNRPPFWVDAPQNENYQYTGEPSGSDPPTLSDKQIGIMRGKLFPYVGDVSGYHCPGDLGRSLVPNSYGGQNNNPHPDNYPYRSYCISDLLNGWRDDDRKVYKMTEIVSPSKKFVFLETTDSRGWIMGSWYFDTENYSIDGLTMWHKKRSGFGYADGHAEMYKWTYEVIIQNCQMESYSDYFTLYPDINHEDVQFLLSGYVPGLRER